MCLFLCSMLAPVDFATFSRPGARLQTTMAPPATNRKTTSGNGRRTRRSTRSAGVSDESLEQNEGAPPDDSGDDEQPKGADSGTGASSQEDDGDETVGTSSNTVAAVVVTQETVGADTPSTPQITAEQSLSKHEHDVGSLLSIDNCKELARTSEIGKVRFATDCSAHASWRALFSTKLAPNHRYVQLGAPQSEKSTG